jgi:hypothetical protein
MIFYFFKKFLSFFKRSILNGIFHFYQHLLILDGDGCHVTIEVIKHAQPFGLDMITLPFHTSHVLQPLDVSCFKSFKTTFKTKRDNAMVINNHYELKKCTFASLVIKILDLIFSKINIKNGFKVT